MSFVVKDGAIFISDSHENSNCLHLLHFLKFIKNQKIKPPQIFFMGDMFDFLSNTDYIQEFYKEQISLINEISKEIECFYFEGNHDFNLSEIFKNLRVFSINEQPVIFDINSKKVALLHGDKFMPFLSLKAVLILRCKRLLKILNFVDKKINGKITKFILKSQKNKILFKDNFDFKSLIFKKIKKYPCNVAIEGHYHQNKSFCFDEFRYINLNSFAVEQGIYEVIFLKEDFKMQFKNLKDKIN